MTLFAVFLTLLVVLDSGVDKRVVFQKGGFGGCSPGKPERGYIRMFPRNENRNEGTFACSPGTKTGTRVRSPKPPFYETALVSPSDKRAPCRCNCKSSKVQVLMLMHLMFCYRKVLVVSAVEGESALHVCAGQDLKLQPFFLHVILRF